MAIVACAAVPAALAVRASARVGGFSDLKIYHDAVVRWANGGALYGLVAPDAAPGFTDPPLTAVAMLPMAILPVGVAGWISLLVSLAALAVALAAILVPIADRCGTPRWFTVALAVPLAGAIGPVRETFGLGEINLLLFALVIADLVALRRRARVADEPAAYRGWFARFWLGGAWAGAGIGLATAVKLTPALFVAYLVVTRQWRAVATALGTAVGATAAAALLAGNESVAYLTGVLWQSDRAGAADATSNQSLAGLLARLYDSAETPGLLWLAFGMLLLAVGLSRAASAHAAGDELTALTLVGLTETVIRPTSWSHQLVFVIPAIVVLADVAIRRHGAARELAARGAGASVAAAQGLAFGAGLRYPIWFPALTGLSHATAAVGVYTLFLISPIWRYRHTLPGVSHYADGVTGMLAENSLALALIMLVAALPWRPGAEQTRRRARSQPEPGRDRRGEGGARATGSSPTPPYHRRRPAASTPAAAP